MAGKQRVIAVAGPTATGKTALGIALAQRLDGEIVSCDSMQVYRGLEIGTAQPDKAELDAVPHHLIGFLDWSRAFSVSDYVSIAAEVIAGIHKRGRIPVLVGGTGLYVRSLLRGFDFKEECRDDKLRQELYDQARRLGPVAMHCRLRELDPVSAEEIHPNNVKRVLRALEYCILSGEAFSKQAERSKQVEPPYDSVLLCPAYPERSQLYARIDARVDRMLEAGLLAEAKRFFDYCEQAAELPTAAQSIGYKELFPYFRGEKSLEEAAADIKRESRRYAKRQLTWFSREQGAYWLDMSEGMNAAIEKSMEILAKKGYLREEARNGL